MPAKINALIKVYYLKENVLTSHKIQLFLAFKLYSPCSQSTQICFYSLYEVS